MYTLKHLFGGIYVVLFKKHEDLWKSFIRYQEHYESPKFHGKVFTLKEYHKWYAKEYKGENYGDHWVGFNIPSYVISSVISGATDLNQYDEVMQKIVSDISHENFYLIGVTKEKDLNHEIAHGLYYTDETYREKTNDLVEKLPEEVFCKIRNKLLRAGYCKNVIIDEVQAYLATGTKSFCKVPSFFCLPFEKLFTETVKRNELVKFISCVHFQNFWQRRL